ncbi:MAG: GH3 auxin-responsive promoter family protein [Bacteroidia bacterium]
MALRLIAEIWSKKLTSPYPADPVGAAQKTFFSLIRTAAATTFGKEHDFDSIHSYEDFRRQVPIRTYEEFLPWLEKVFQGEPDTLWPNKPLYLAKTSGTTAGAKYIPLSKQAIRSQISTARKALEAYIRHYGAKFLAGKMLFLSGSPALEKNPAGILTGRLSGISHHWVPRYLRKNRLPSFYVNTLENWEEKVEASVREALATDLRFISGIPPWIIDWAEKVLEITHRKPLQVWKNLHVYFHGGVDFRPYATLIDEALGGKIIHWETYPASEGFFAFQDTPDPQAGLLLQLTNGIFYEFVPLQQYFEKNPPRLPLWEVKENTPYALILSTNTGLWAYSIGDVVTFTSLQPPRIRVVGRVKHTLNAFGEHVIEEEINAALLCACQKTHAQVAEYTVAPLVRPPHSRYEWFVEFVHPPQELTTFIQALDLTLQKQNPYYADLRKADMLKTPALHFLPIGSCYHYMQSQGKLGGQNKFPHLRNDREIVKHLIPCVTFSFSEDSF